MYFDQSEYDMRCEWGLEGIINLAPLCDVVVIVDVLSFSTCVDIAVGRGAVVYPHRWDEGSAEAFAGSIGAAMAGSRRSATSYSLSPVSLLTIEAGTKLVLPSPNGATLTLAAGDTPVIAGCIRNAQAVAQAAQALGKRILVAPAGERWSNGALRPAIEDLIGAGAIINHLNGASTKSPEAKVAEGAFVAASHDLAKCLQECSSGKELIERGFAEDVELAAQLDVSKCVPVLKDGAYKSNSKM